MYSTAIVYLLLLMYVLLRILLNKREKASGQLEHTNIRVRSCRRQITRAVKNVTTNLQEHQVSVRFGQVVGLEGEQKQRFNLW